MSVVIVFRPTLDQQFQLKVNLQGRNGLWKGRDTGTFDFGTQIHCGNKPPIGTQDVTIKVQLQCTEGENLVITGFLDIRVAKTISRFNLPAAIMDCPRGGPGCLVEWPYLFFNEYLGNGSITVRGVETA
jgi:hypothetical protein